MSYQIHTKQLPYGISSVVEGGSEASSGHSRCQKKAGTARPKGGQSRAFRHRPHYWRSAVPLAAVHRLCGRDNVELSFTLRSIIS